MEDLTEQLRDLLLDVQATKGHLKRIWDKLPSGTEMEEKLDFANTALRDAADLVQGSLTDLESGT
jgi:hypothetical protein